MEKHTAYYNLLEQLLKPGCPVCAQVLESLKSFLDNYLYEGVNDKDNWNRLVASDGYCPRHCAMMEDFSDGLAVSLFYGHLYKQSIQALGKKEKKSFFSSAKKEPCPACTYEAQIESNQVLLFTQGMDEAEFKKTYEEKNEGLCLLHTRQVCALDGEHAAHIKALAEKKLGPVIREMDEYVRKSDHRNTMKMGAEGDAWKRALRKFYGIRYGGRK